MARDEAERQLRWLMILRLVIVTTLLVAAFAIEVLLRPGNTLRPLFFMSAAAYGLVVVYAILDRWLAGTRTFLYLQLVGDALIVSVFVGITGGLDSPMSFLYLLPIGVASLLRYRRGGLALAGMCWLLYVGLVLFEVPWLPGSWVVRSPLPREAGRVGYFLVVHLVAFVSVALLGAYLADRLRIQGNELDERRGAVDRLRALMENIIESINSGLMTTDLNGRIHFMNRGGTEITASEPSEVEGRSVEEFLGLEAGFLRETRQLLLARHRYRFERYFTRPDGRRIFLGVAVSTLKDRADAPLGYIFIFQDLTEIQALEQEVRLKERMAALGEMAAGMAHELRNPLAAISGSVQFLKGSVEPGGEAQELMDIILRESQRLDQAIRDFLTFARPGKFAPERCDLARLIEENVRLLRNSREFGPHHRAETRFDEREIWCEIDPNRIRQVFWNLATNALRAMPDGGTLGIDAGFEDDGERVFFAFSDEGVGMDERAMEGYFQPFRGSFERGTGLGAAIVYRLVEEHQGRIHVESAPGRGTRVGIFLPRYRTVSAAEPLIQRAAAGGQA